MNGVKRAERYVSAALKKGAKNFPETIKQACRRHRNDKKRKDIYFDVDAANFACGFLEQMPHTKGELQGQKLRLEDWQCFIISCLFGWKDKTTGYRRFRYFTIIVPRKNGKTAIAVGLGFLMLGPDQEPGAEIYFGATGEKHAKRLLYKPAKYLAENWEDYSDLFNIEAGASNIVRTDNDSLLTTVIRNPGDGDSPHFAVVDEYHEHKDSEQYDTFKSGMGGRLQPMLGAITTAGSNLGGPCKVERDECLKVLRGEMNQDDKFILIYEPDEKDHENWDSLEVLKKVNPNFGISVTENYLLSELNTARQSATKQSLYKTKHLNMWVGAKTQWMNMLEWQKQGKKNLSIDDFEGEPCHITGDLASKIDVASLHITFKRDDEYFSFPYFYVPESAVEKIDTYQRFRDSGELIVTDGDMTDYEFIEDQILEFNKRFDVRSVCFDPFQATYLITRLMEHHDLSDKVFELGATVKNFSEPMKELEGRVKARQYWHDNNACMTWMVGNTVAKVDAKDNIFPNKENKDDKRCRIDGVVSAIMGVARWIEDDSQNIDMDDLIDNMII